MRKYLALLVLLAIAITFPCGAAKLITATATADLAYNNSYSAITEGNSLTISLDLPFTLESINNTNSNITVVADSSTDSTIINLTVNGVAVATNYTITGGSSHTWTLPDFEAAGVNMSDTYLNIVIFAGVNNTTAEYLNLTCNDKPVVANFTYSVTETLLSKPAVKYYDIDSFYSVKQNITVTQDSDVNITDLTIALSYPSNALNQPVTEYNFGSLNTSETKYYVVSFQKRGPYVEMIKTSESSSSHTTKIYIRALESFSASMEFDPTKSPWSKYFPDFSEDRITEIELNGKEVSWEKGSIVISTMSLSEGVNILNVTYSKPAAVVPPVTTTVPLIYQTIYGVPVWLIVAAIILILVILAASRYE